MISTSFISGTGFMKCMPITRSGRLDRAPIAVIEIDDVFGRQDRRRRGRPGPSALEDLALESSTFSVAASTTKSTASRSPP